MKLDKLDKQILEVLQTNADLSLAQLAEAVHLSATPCWRRVQKMQAEGVISRQVALLNPAALNLGVTVFVAIKSPRHSVDWFEKFASGVSAIPEVMEFYRLSGDTDYLLKVMVPDIAAYDGVYKKLIACTEMFDVSSSFVMETLKATTALPLSYA